MKKLIAAIAAAFMLTLGLVAVTEAPASAACPYSACINTTTIIHNRQVLQHGKAIAIKVFVLAPGNVTPTGAVTVTVSRVGSGVKFQSTQAYLGGQATFVTQ